MQHWFSPYFQFYFFWKHELVNFEEDKINNFEDEKEIEVEDDIELGNALEKEQI